MNTNPVNVAVVDGKTIIETTALQAANAGQPVRIKAIASGKYILAEGDKGVAPENITIKRVGKDLHVALEGTDPDQPQLIIEDFFDNQGQLVGVAEDGTYHEYISSDAEQDHSAAFLIDGVSSPQVLGAEELVGFGDGLVAGGAGIGWFWPALLGLAGVGLLGAAYASSREDDDDNHQDNGGGSVNRPLTPGLEGVNDNVGDKTGLIENGGVTDDSTPTFSGNGTPGNTVVVTDNGKIIGEVIVGDDGKWEYTPDTPMADGSHEIVVVEKDPAGNESDPSDGYEIIIDLTAPGKSVINDAQDDVGTQKGVIGQNGFTDDNTPTLNGTAEAGATVEVFANGVKIGQTTANADGSWSFTPELALVDGGYTFTTVAVDAAGNRGLASDPYVLNIDTTAPGKPGEGGNGGIDTVNDDVGTVQGPIENGGSTDDTTPTLGGSGQQPGDTVTIKDNGKVIGETKVDEDGNWTYTPSPPLSDGKHDLSIIVTDPAGNSSEESDPYTVIVDTTAPGQPTITELIDDQGTVTGPIAAGTTTDDAQPEIKGTAEPGSTVIIYDKGEKIGTAPVDASGNWTFLPSPPLTNGSHELSVAAMDAAGNVGEKSPAFDFEVLAGGAPTAPAITDINDDVGIKKGNLSPGDITDDARPTINGTGEVGATISVYAGGKLLGTTEVQANGQWSFTPPADLVEGLNNITATATNAAGNVSPETGLYPITVDTAEPGSATDEVLSDDVGTVRGPISNGDTTDDSNPTLSGTAEAGSTVIIYDKGVEIGREQVNADGKWSYTPSTPLADGAHSFNTVIEDAAGNQSAKSTPIDFTVDTRAVEISITEVTDNEGTVKDPLSNGGVTDDTTPTLNGKATPNSIVHIYDNGKLLDSVTSDGSGNWTYTPSAALGEGDHSFTATVETAAGGESEPTAKFDLEIDTTAPGKPGEGDNGGIDKVNDDVGDKQGPIANGGSTDDTTPTLSGGGQQPGDTVTIKDNGKVIGETKVDDKGNWTYTPTPPLNDGKHDFSIIVTDPAGNDSPESDPYTVIVDTTAPGQPVITEVVDDQGVVKGPITAGTTTDDAQPEIKGTAEPGSTVIIYDKGEKIGTAPVDASGNWTFLPSPPLTNGSHELSVAAMDAAGNIGDKSAEFDFEVIAGGTPTAPAITEIKDDVGIKKGNLSPGDITDDPRPTINGTGEVGATISVFADGKLLGTTKVQANGQWSFTPPADLVEGLNNITASATNAAGNVSPETGLYPITVDTAEPGSATDEVLKDDVGTVKGPISSGDTTDDSTPTLSGTAEAGSTVIIYDKGVEIGREQVNADGKWSYTPSTPLADGDHSFNTVIEDAAGNQSAKSTPIDFTVDTRAVEISITEVTDNEGTVQDPLSNGGVTDDTTPTLNGKATPNSIVHIYDNGKLLDSVTSDGSGNWTYTPSPALGEGDHSFTATVETAAGGESEPTAKFDLEIDTTAPGKPGEGDNGGIDKVNDDVGDKQGPIANGGSTDDTTPTLSGGGQQPGDTVTIKDNGKVIGETKVNEDGNWTYTPTPPLNDGKHDFSIIVTDPAGNDSPESDPYTVIVDTTAPTTTAVVESMGKDSGGDSGDYLTNDGSAGRLIKGSLSAALAANEKVQVSVDGGTTWLDAVLNGDETWSFVDETAHEANWEIQSRVVDAAGNVGVEQSVEITLDATAPNAPTDLTVSTDNVRASFDSTANEGDSIVVLWGDYSVEYELSAADIVAGFAEVTIPAEILELSSSPTKIHVGVIDGAGNASDYRVQKHNYNISENFEGAPIASYAKGKSYDFGQVTATVMDGTLYSESRNDDNPDSRNLEVVGTTRFAIDDGTATTLTIECSALNASATIKFYNSEGELVHSGIIPRGPQNLNFEMPAGVEYSYFEVAGDFYNWGDQKFQGGVLITDIQADADYTTQEIVSPPSEQLILDGASYYGGDEDNNFIAADVMYFEGADSGVHGNGGIDTLTLNGKDQILDLTEIGEKLSSIEVIDLKGTGDNTLKLSLDDVLNNGETDLFLKDGKTQMMVNGDAGDVVDLQGLISAEDPGSWGAQGNVTVGGVVYDVYTHSSLDAELLVQQGVTTNLV